MLADVEWLHGRRDEAYAHLEAAQALIADGSRIAGDGPASSARRRDTTRSPAAVLRRSPSAVRPSPWRTPSELDEVQAHALCNLSIAKRLVGDRSGDDDLARSIEIARAANSVELGRALNNLAMQAVEAGEFRRAVALLEEAIAFDESIGSTDLWPGSLVAA